MRLFYTVSIMFFIRFGYAQDEVLINWEDLIIEEREEKYDSNYHYYMELPIFNEVQNELNNKRVTIKGTLLKFKGVWVFTNPKLVKDHFHSPVIDQSILIKDYNIPKTLKSKTVIENVKISAVLKLNIKNNIDDLPFLFEDISLIKIE